MAIIKCPECGAEVSDKAEQCLKCAYPIAKKSTQNEVQTIEQTGKNLKLQLVLAIIVMFIGVFVFAISGREFVPGLVCGGLVIFMGLVWSIVVKIRIWWNHR